MKIFKPPVVEFELWDTEGAKKFTIPTLTRDIVNKVRKVDLEGDDAVYEQMAIILGGKKENYFKYDIRVITDVLKEFAKEITNPTRQS